MPDPISELQQERLQHSWLAYFNDLEKQSEPSPIAAMICLYEHCQKTTTNLSAEEKNYEFVDLYVSAKILLDSCTQSPERFEAHIANIAMMLVLMTNSKPGCRFVDFIKTCTQQPSDLQSLDDLQNALTGFYTTIKDQSFGHEEDQLLSLSIRRTNDPVSTLAVLSNADSTQELDYFAFIFTTLALEQLLIDCRAVVSIGGHTYDEGQHHGYLLLKQIAKILDTNTNETLPAYKFLTPVLLPQTLFNKDSTNYRHLIPTEFKAFEIIWLPQLILQFLNDNGGRIIQEIMPEQWKITGVENLINEFSRASPPSAEKMQWLIQRLQNVFPIPDKAKKMALKEQLTASLMPLAAAAATPEPEPEPAPERMKKSRYHQANDTLREQLNSLKPTNATQKQLKRQGLQLLKYNQQCYLQTTKSKHPDKEQRIQELIHNLLAVKTVIDSQQKPTGATRPAAIKTGPNCASQAEKMLAYSTTDEHQQAKTKRKIAGILCIIAGLALIATAAAFLGLSFGGSAPVSIAAFVLASKIISAGIVFGSVKVAGAALSYGGYRLFQSTPPEAKINKLLNNIDKLKTPDDTQADTTAGDDTKPT